jgi:hypothetical protein
LLTTIEENSKLKAENDALKARSSTMLPSISRLGFGQSSPSERHSANSSGHSSTYSPATSMSSSVPFAQPDASVSRNRVPFSFSFGQSAARDPTASTFFEYEAATKTFSLGTVARQRKSKRA